MNEYKIIGYITENGNIDFNNVDVSKLTHINYAFGLVKNDRISVDHLNKLDEMKIFKEKNPNIKILLSIGGWGADGFSDAALSEESRTNFTNSGIEIVKKYGFDGLDIDWEYPCSSQANIISRPEDKHNFTLMLKSLRDELDKLGTINNRYYMLTIAAGAGKIFSENTELDIIHNYLDFINIMTYDLCSSFDNQTGHHTALYKSDMDPERLCGDEAVKLMLDAKVPAEKIVFGAAFYGRGFPDVENKNNGFKQIAHSPGGQYYSYSEIHENYLNKNGFKRFWDDSAKSPYVFNGSTFISYEDEESLKNKIEYVKTNHLGGIMFWEYILDKTGILLDTIYNGLK